MLRPWLRSNLWSSWRRPEMSRGCRMPGSWSRGYGRYFGAFKCHPWDPGAPDCSGEDNSRQYTATVPDFSESGIDYQLTEQGFLKPQFANRRSIRKGELLVSTNDERRVSVCFEPQSRKGRIASPLGLRDSTNQTNQECADPDGYPDLSCYVCLGY